MIAKKHLNHNSIKSGDFWHRHIQQRNNQYTSFYRSAIAAIGKSDFASQMLLFSSWKK